MVGVRDEGQVRRPRDPQRAGRHGLRVSWDHGEAEPVDSARG